jgi:hypothetical protein
VRALRRPRILVPRGQLRCRVARFWSCWKVGSPRSIASHRRLSQPKWVRSISPADDRVSNSPCHPPVFLFVRGHFRLAAFCPSRLSPPVNGRLLGVRMILQKRQFLIPLRVQCLFRDAKNPEILEKFTLAEAPNPGLCHPQPGCISPPTQRACQENAALSPWGPARRTGSARIRLRLMVSTPRNWSGKGVRARSPQGRPRLAGSSFNDPPLGRGCPFSGQSAFAAASMGGQAATWHSPRAASRFHWRSILRLRLCRFERVRCCLCSPLGFVRQLVPARASVFGGALRPPRGRRLCGSSVPGREVALFGPPLVC